MVEATLDRAQRAGWTFLAASSLVLLPTVFNSVDGDCHVYLGAARALFSGELPYLDRPLEYPPYAIPFFVFPYLISGLEAGFRHAFAAEMLLIDLALKALLLREGKTLASGWRSLLPLALFALDGWLQEFVYLKRYDLVPSFFVAWALVCMYRDRPRCSGVSLAIGTGVKLYPLVLLPVFLALAARRRETARFLSGVALGFAPLALLSFALPWWRFLSFHAGRGLQAESVAASVVWWLHRTVSLDASWGLVRSWFEVGGPIAEALRVPAKVVFAVAVVSSTAVGTLAAHRHRAASMPAAASLLLLPLLAFITFNNVLSPQYLIWCFPLVGVAALEGQWTVPILMVLAAALIPTFYPSAEYYAGPRLARATALLLRNVVLVAAWVATLGRALPALRPREH